jgi:hypothetical protein
LILLPNRWARIDASQAERRTYRVFIYVGTMQSFLYPKAAVRKHLLLSFCERIEHGRLIVVRPDLRPLPRPTSPTRSAARAVRSNRRSAHLAWVVDMTQKTAPRTQTTMTIGMLSMMATQPHGLKNIVSFFLPSVADPGPQSQSGHELGAGAPRVSEPEVDSLTRGLSYRWPVELNRHPGVLFPSRT